MSNPFALSYDLLFVQAGVVGDIEAVRIANENRLRQLTRTGTDKDGQERGFGLSEDISEVRVLTSIVDSLRDVEAVAIKNLERSMRDLPIGSYVKDTPGLGLKQTARLLAAIGDPYWHAADDRPRLVSELWSYAGYSVTYPTGDQNAGESLKRRKGSLVTWSPDARMRTFLISESCVKARTSPFRVTYDTARSRYKQATHRLPCARCGPKGKPAQPGSPLSAGHQHARALRAVGKDVLKSLWIASKREHEDYWEMKTDER